MENITVPLNELTHLALYKLALAEIVASAGGEISIKMNIHSKPLFICYSVEEGDIPSEICIKITVNRVGNVH